MNKHHYISLQMRNFNPFLQIEEKTYMTYIFGTLSRNNLNARHSSGPANITIDI